MIKYFYIVISNFKLETEFIAFLLKKALKFFVSPHLLQVSTPMGFVCIYYYLLLGFSFNFCFSLDCIIFYKNIILAFTFSDIVCPPTLLFLRCFHFGYYSNFIIKWWCHISCSYPALASVSFLNLWVLVLIKFVKKLANIYSHIFLTFSATPITYSYQRPLSQLFIYLFCYFLTLCFSLHSLLIFFSALTNLPLGLLLFI